MKCLNYKKHLYYKGLFLITLFFVLPNLSFAGIYISEIMYDLPGTDTDREWIEIYNDGGAPLDLTDWKVDDGADSKHTLNTPPKNGGKGDLNIAPSEYIILADKADIFLSEHPGFSGKVIDTVLNLANKGEKISLIDQSASIADSITYSDVLGGKDDGNSLHRSGADLKAGLPTPGEAYKPNEVVTNDSASAQNNNGGATTTSTAVGGSNFPVEPRIFTSIIGEKVAMVGVETIFKSETIGIDKKPINNARTIWSFGDGATKDGQVVSHTWLHGGSYMIILEASSGEFNASARQRVEVLPADISIAEVKIGSDGYVSLRNNLNHDVEISRFIIIAGNKSFIIPAPTIILAKSVLPLPNSVTGLNPDVEMAELFYPNGQKIISFVKNLPNLSNVEPQVRETLPEKVKPVKEVAKAPVDILNDSENGQSSTTVIYSASVGKSNTKSDWALALFGLVGVTAVGVLFSIGKKRDLIPAGSGQVISSGEVATELKAEDFNIIEDDDEYDSK